MPRGNPNIAQYAAKGAAAAKKARQEKRAAAVPIDTRFVRYRDDPAAFVTDCLGATSATRRSDGSPYQFQVLADLAAFPRVAVRSGHGIGKSALDSWALLWFLLSRPHSRVVVLAPEYSRQIRAILFAEVRRWVRRATVKLPVQVLASRVQVGDYGDAWSAQGMSTSGDPDKIEGFHSEEGGVLVIADETKGIPQAAFDAIQGALSSSGGDSKLLVTSVPGGAGAGPFWKIFARGGSRWRMHHVPSTDSTLVAPSWLDDMAGEWGIGSPLWQTRVLGEFADAGEGVIFPLSLLEAAMQRGREPVVRNVYAEAMAAPEPVTLGVDVARSSDGDLNTIAECRGNRTRVLATWRSPDTMVTTEKVVQTVATSGATLSRVDVTGVGAGVADRLAQLGHATVAFAFGGGARDPRRFRNGRAEIFWGLRERLEKDLCLPDDDQLFADLSSLRYFFTASGQIQLESKDETRRRLGRSPDRADAVALACAAPGVAGSACTGLADMIDI
ncbi:MAG: hypothetical protein HY700_17315 [Gemmatimonadetes bacterium]|nr:hypothetical protein [Gemmatimonadota bacterium]